MEQISKTEFKARALEVLREIEQSDESKVITDRSKPIIKIREFRQHDKQPLELLQGSVIKYEAATEPVDDWENAR